VAPAGFWSVTRAHKLIFVLNFILFGIVLFTVAAKTSESSESSYETSDDEISHGK